MMVSHNKPTQAPSISSGVTACKGIGPKTATTLKRLGIATIEDLIYHLPRSHLDRRNVIPIAELQSSSQAVVKGQVQSVKSFRSSRRLNITQCVIRDDTGSTKAIWFNQPYLKKTLLKGTDVILSGGVSVREGIQLDNPEIEILSDNEKDIIHTLGLTPVYPLTEGIGQKQMRRIVRAALDDFLIDVPENLPAYVLKENRLSSRRDALSQLHFPDNPDRLESARRRIAFEEFLTLQLSVQTARSIQPGRGTAHTAPPSITPHLSKSLPFDLTSAQERVITKITERMESNLQMNALLQGDVGAGKTIVAAYAMLKAIENSRQAVLMAPTEILAEQHFSNLNVLLGQILHENGTRIALLTGSQPTPDKNDVLDLLDTDEPALVIGTHALIQRKVTIRNAGLIIIDEQHRFGVNQRAALREKGVAADLLIMTATPIPRTLALILYGDFEILVLDECPPGRRPVKTLYLTEQERKQVYTCVREQIKSGRQIFVVCPEIGGNKESEGRPVADTRKAYKEYKAAFRECSIDMLHGSLSPEERDNVIQRFRANDIQILIATTIVEVGVDVPNATLIIIEDADRFGLAQLHQLRGRVGRSRHRSRCILIAEPTTPEAIKRIEYMTSISDGFKLAEYDLLLRGPGEFLGAAQSGLPRLRIGHLIKDAPLLETAKEATIEILKTDPRLENPENRPLLQLLGKNPETVHL